MKAITLWRPWAWALFHGKPVENRTWPLPDWMLGKRTAIHAGKKYDREAEEFICDELELSSLPPEAKAQGIVGVVTWDRLVSGVLLGISAEPQDDPILTSPWYFGPFGWVHRDAVELDEPVPCRGALGFWTVPSDIEALIRKQVSS